MPFKLDNYEMHKKWLLPIFGGYSLDHFSKATKESTWKGKTVQVFTGIIEAIPVLGHIVSLAEKYMCSKPAVFKGNNPNVTMDANGNVTIKGNCSNVKVSRGTKISLFGITILETDPSISIGKMRGVWHVLKGSGNIISEKRDVAPFTNICSEGPIDVVVTQSDHPEVNVTADDNLMSYISTIVENGKLFIRVKRPQEYSSISCANVKISLNVTKVEEIINSGTGNMSANNELKFDNLKIVNKGTGNMEMGVNGQTLEVVNSGTGNVRLSGSAANQTVSNNGTGNYEAMNLQSDSAALTNKGTGNAFVQAKTDLKVNSLGTGNVHYKGDATLSQQNRGTGSIKKV